MNMFLHSSLAIVAFVLGSVAPVISQMADHPSMFKSSYNDTRTVDLGSYESDKLGYPTLWHSQTAYCLDYDDRDYDTNQYTEGFQFAYHIQDSSKSTEGYIGYQPDLNAIIISFRGSEDINNWISDLAVIRVDYPYCDGCSVHQGFLHAEQAVYPDILNAVKDLSNSHRSATIVLTGHSLGAALALLTALDLANDGFKPKVYNYGCPRIFNQAGADFASSSSASGVTVAARRTHYKDMVVHTPMHSLGFVHTSGEVYETGPSSDEDWGQFPGAPLQACVGEEDASCSDQWSFTSVSDHLLYSGLQMGIDGCGALYGNKGRIVGTPPSSSKL